MSNRKKQPLAVIVGANITAKRKHLGLNQAQFAEKLGIGPDSLSRIERGLAAPRFQTLEKMALILGCPVAELFLTGDDTSFRSFVQRHGHTDSALSEIIFMAEKIIQTAKGSS
ncbi:helix-turn-helix domain-containing protein [Mailhella massiliensis]|uniref:Helix-turn-helix domain-containing protein n=1 Tax=Mailhella massiliensis TaxID=1903261 RepID=A0A921DSB4_9BACT|nr:helix-turn-helix transcriptional regulator [Mailhella massiliensis]HJD97983.1 helix-turn-helix domain-containing protein [Mailhella massiliensis]